MPQPWTAGASPRPQVKVIPTESCLGNNPRQPTICELKVIGSTAVLMPNQKKYYQRTGNLEYALLNPHPNCIFSRCHPPESESNDPEPCRPNEVPKRQGSRPEPDSHRLIEGSPLKSLLSRIRRGHRCAMPLPTSAVGLKTVQGLSSSSWQLWDREGALLRAPSW